MRIQLTKYNVKLCFKSLVTSGKFSCNFCSVENLAGSLTIDTIFLGDPFLLFKKSSLGELLSPKSNSHMPGRKLAMLGGCWKLHQNPPPDDIKVVLKAHNCGSQKNQIPSSDM